MDNLKPVTPSDFHASVLAFWVRKTEERGHYE